jgi:hypothetical protein
MRTWNYRVPFMLVAEKILCNFRDLCHVIGPEMYCLLNYSSYFTIKLEVVLLFDTVYITML